MFDLSKNKFYRLETLIALLGSDNGYTINQLSEVLDVNKPILREDIIALFNNNDEDFFLDIDENDDGKADDFFDEGVVRKRIRSGECDDASLYLSYERVGDVELVLSSEEADCLNDFLGNHPNSGEEVEASCLMKNSMMSISDEEIEWMDTFDLIIREGTALEFIYYAPGFEPERKCIRPVKLIHNIDSHNIYVVDTEEKIYRFDRMKLMKPSNKRIDIPDGVQYDKFDMMWGVEHSEPIHVRLKIYDEANVIDRIRRELGHRCEGKIREFEGHFLYEDDIIGVNSFRSWVSGYGSSVVVLEPQELAENIIAAAKRISAS